VTKLKCVFFDLGDTLLHRVNASPDGTEYQWAPGAKQLLADLTTREIRLGLISNTGDLNRSQLRELLPPDFSFEEFNSDMVILSSEVGISKPDPRIFRLAICRAQSSINLNRTFSTDPEECLFCGESLIETLSAQAAGMRSARVNGSLQPELGSLLQSLAKSGLL
jgi:putative hydrolase of the HAD superfamily